MKQIIETKLGVIIILIFAVTVGAFVWKWEKNQPEIQQPKITYNMKKSTANNFNQTDLVYENKEYGFRMSLPEEMKNNYEVHFSKIGYVGQKDSCNDCALIQFVVPTEDKNTCDLMECGKKILFVVWARNINDWGNKNIANGLSCNEEATVIAKTDKYVYNLCPFNATISEQKYYPEDSLKLLEKALLTVRNSFTVE